MKTRESKFVSALDKILPPLNIFSDGGRTWKETKVTLKMIREHKEPRIKISPEIYEYWKELLKELEKKERDLFFIDTNGLS